MRALAKLLPSTRGLPANPLVHRFPPQPFPRNVLRSTEPPKLVSQSQRISDLTTTHFRRVCSPEIARISAETLAFVQKQHEYRVCLIATRQEDEMNRHEFLKTMTAGTASLFASRWARGDEPPGDGDFSTTRRRAAATFNWTHSARMRASGSP